MGAANEHLDEAAVQAAAKQQALTQQTTSSAQPAAGGTALGSAAGAGANPFGAGAGAANPASRPTPPREVGSIAEELVQRPVHDIGKELMAFFDLNTLLGINPQQDTPQEQARKKQMLQRWNNLNQEQQAVAQEKYQTELRKKQKEEQEKEARKQQEAQQAQSFQVPSSPKKGPERTRWFWQATSHEKLQQDRKTLSGPSSSN